MNRVVFVFKKDVDEVLLHASVVDDKQHIVTTLDRSAFTVFEDGKPQNIISFHHETFRSQWASSSTTRDRCARSGTK